MTLGMTFTMGCVEFQPSPACGTLPHVQAISVSAADTEPSVEGRGLLGNPSIYSCLCGRASCLGQEGRTLDSLHL